MADFKPILRISLLSNVKVKKKYPKFFLDNFFGFKKIVFSFKNMISEVIVLINKSLKDGLQYPLPAHSFLNWSFFGK